MTNTSIPEPTPLRVVCVNPANPAEPCPICGGMGMIKYAVPVDDPRFGKMFRCPNHPVEADTERQERLRRLSNLNAFNEKQFENFEVNPNYSPQERDSLLRAFDAARTFAAQPEGWLLLEGGYGCGKTHLAAAVGHLRLKHGDFVLFVTTPDLLDYLRHAYDPRAEATFDETFDRVRNATLLILDDLGVENPSPWAQEKLFQLLNHRYSHKKPTIITTNVSINDLDARLSSRLLDTQIVHHVRITAPDYRTFRSNEDRLLANLSNYTDMSFTNFDVSTRLTAPESQHLQRLQQACISYAADPRGWFVLTGDDVDGKMQHGNGKTHLAAAIALKRRDSGDTVIFATAADMMDYLRESYSATSMSSRFERRFQTLRDVKLLVVDDLNTRQASEWVREKIFQILDYRYVRRLPTVITLKSLGEIESRLTSRLLDERCCVMFKVAAPTYAIRMKRNAR